MNHKVYHKNNFYRNTFCVFKEVSFNDFIGIIPNYKSKTGSEYYFIEKGVYRVSNHWGRAAGCRWRLDSENYKQQQQLIGYADWTDFFPNDETQQLYFIHQTDLNTFSFNHKQSSLYEGKAVLRNAADTSKVLKQIKELQQNPSVLKYIPCDDKQQLVVEIIHQLIYTNKSYSKIKIELTNK